MATVVRVVPPPIAQKFSVESVLPAGHGHLAKPAPSQGEDLPVGGRTPLPSIAEVQAEVVAAADRVIDLGPEAGELGGEVVFEGSLKDFLKEADQSRTAKCSTARSRPRR